MLTNPNHSPKKKEVLPKTDTQNSNLQSRRKRKLDLIIIDYDKVYDRYILSDYSKWTLKDLKDKYPNLLQVWSNTKKH